jgi:hypothetical protein
MAELREVATILDSGKVEEEDLQSALQAILFHQCLYEDWPHAPAYRLLVRHIAHVQPILGAFGYRLTHHPVAHMLVLEAQGVVYGIQMSRLRKDETVVLLVLRLLYAEGLSSLDENGRVEITTDDLHDRLRTSGEVPPAMTRLLEILRLFHRKGIVRIGERDLTEQLVVLTVMPGITMLVPDVYVEAAIQWLEQREMERMDQAEDEGTAIAESILGHVAEYRANLGAAEEPAGEDLTELDEGDDDVPA